MNILEQKSSKLISKTRRSGTTPELVVRHLLRELGVQYRLQGKGLPGTPDIVNRESYWAIFVQGCLPYGHDCKHGAQKSKTNSRAWDQKNHDKRERDRQKRIELESAGYLVLEVWECETRNPIELAGRVELFIKKARGRLEVFCYDRKNSLIERRVRVEGKRWRKTKLSTLGIKVGSAHDVFDQVCLRSSKRPRPSRNGAGTLSVADLFSGCGGLSLGVQEACRASGRYFRSVLAADTSEAAMRVYCNNFSPEHVLTKPIENWLDGELGSAPTPNEAQLLERLDDVNIVVAGPPCQGHSNLNNHTRRNDDRNALCLRVVRFAELLGPEYVIIENVGASVHDEKQSIHKARKHLEFLWYNCDSTTVDLWKIGVPQLRKRHLLVASKKKRLDIQSIIDHHDIDTSRGVAWALGDLEDTIGDTLLDQSRRLSEENCSRIRWLFENDEYDLPNYLRPKCHQGEHSYYAMYGRLRQERVANTVTTGFGSPGQGRYIHPSKQRTLTAHEAARLQFFPDFFDFSSVDRYKDLSAMIGNAVPMKASYLITLALLADA